MNNPETAFREGLGQVGGDFARRALRVLAQPPWVQRTLGDLVTVASEDPDVFQHLEQGRAELLGELLPVLQHWRGNGITIGDVQPNNPGQGLTWWVTEDQARWIIEELGDS